MSFFLNHQKSMDLLAEANSAGRAGDSESEYRLTREAFLMELDVANGLSGLFEAEPTRSIILISAANLAIRLEEYDEALKLACLGLTGTPDSESTEQFLQIIDEIRFLKEFGNRFQLNEQGLSFYLRGNLIGCGKAAYEEVRRRVEAARNLFIRGMEFLAGRDYRVKGRPSKNVSDASQVVCAFQTGSLNVQLSFGLGQLELEMDQTGESALELATNFIESLHQQNFDNLAALISDADYLESFRKNTLDLLPDGKDVSFVAIQSVSHQTRKVLEFVDTREYYSIHTQHLVSKLSDADLQDVEVLNGEIQLLSSENEDGKFKLLLPNGTKTVIQTTKVIATETLPAYFGRQVEIKVARKGSMLQLVDFVNH